MSTENKQQDQIAELLRQVGPRPTVPAEREHRVREAVHLRWNQAIRVRRRQRMAWASSAVAAGVTAVVLLTPSLRDQLRSYLATPVAEGSVGTVVAVQGLVWHAPPGTAESLPGRRLMVEEELEVDTRVEATADARTAIRLADGRSLRLDRGTRIRFLGPTVIELASGAVYVDSELEPEQSTPIEIRTALGRVFEMGTQFEVRLLDEGGRVRVREGAVNLSHEGQAFAVAAGTELSIDRSGSVSRRQVPVAGPHWDWVLEIAPAYELEGSSLPTFLVWVSRETGWSVSYADPTVAATVSGIVVHGSVENLRPDQALEAVLPTCGLTSKLNGGRLVLESLPE